MGVNVDLAVTKVTMVEREGSQVGSMTEPGLVSHYLADSGRSSLPHSHLGNEGEYLKGLFWELNMLRQCNGKINTLNYKTRTHNHLILSPDMAT